MVTSYISLIQFIESFASNHLQVQRFQAEFEDQMPNFATDGEAFPVLFMSPVSTEFGEFADKYTVNFFCYAQIQKDRSDVNNVFSDTQLILNDLKKFIKDSENVMFGIEADANSIPMREITMDYVIGNTMTVTIDVDTYTICDIPFSDAPIYPVLGCDITYARFLTCETLGDCGTFTEAVDNLQEQINALSGATPDLSGYLPLSGGTLTGPLVGTSFSASTLFVTNENWTIELMDAQTLDFYAPYNMVIQSYNTILSASTIALFDDDVAYTTGNTIISGSKITVSASTATVINLNTTH